MPGGVQILRSSASAVAEHMCDRSEVSSTARYMDDAGALRTPLSEWHNGVETVLDRGLTEDQLTTWLEGFDPRTGESFGTPRELIALDATVTAHKEDSVLAIINPGYKQVLQEVLDDTRAAMLGDFSRKAVTRIGGRHAQVETGDVAIQVIHVEHESSRSGDPHLHQHTLVSVRVRDAEGTWRGLWTTPAVNDLRASRQAAEVVYATHPARLAWLREHGYRLDERGHIAELADVVAPFSQRHRQIVSNRQRYEAEWRLDNPGKTPTAKLRSLWDALGWKEDRPAKESHADLPERTRDRLRALGYDPTLPGARPGRGPSTSTAAAGVEVVDVDQVAEAATIQLEAKASAWSISAVREAAGAAAVEAVALHGVELDRVASMELVDQIEHRMLTRMHSLIEDQTLPTRVTRHLTTARIEGTHDQMEEFFGALAAHVDKPPNPSPAAASRAAEAGLNSGQTAAVALVAGDARLAVVIGRAGTGKTTMLKTAREQIEADGLQPIDGRGRGRKMLGAAPTKRAAGELSEAVGIPATSVHALLMAHGYRQGPDGLWDLIEVGTLEKMEKQNGQNGGRVRPWMGPSAAYSAPKGSTLVIDEASMLAVPEAIALTDMAGRNGWRLVLVGDPHQLAQVGRGGVMQAAAAWAGEHATVEMSHVVRHKRPDGSGGWVVDDEYPQLLERLLDAATDDERTAVATELVERGERGERHGAAVILDDADAADALLAVERSRDPHLVIVTATNTGAQTVHDLERSISTEADRAVVPARDQQPIGVGDTIATRNNNRDLNVRNRDQWTVTAIDTDPDSPTAGSITVVPIDKPHSPARHLPAEYVRDYVHGAGAGTGHSWQGHTGRNGRTRLSEATDQRGLYVGLSRATDTNQLVIVAEDRQKAIEQIAASIGRDNADPGLATLRERVRLEAAQRQPVLEQPAPAAVLEQPAAAADDELLLDVSSASSSYSALDKVSVSEPPVQLTPVEQLVADTAAKFDTTPAALLTAHQVDGSDGQITPSQAVAMQAARINRLGLPTVAKYFDRTSTDVLQATRRVQGRPQLLALAEQVARQQPQPEQDQVDQVDESRLTGAAALQAGAFSGSPAAAERRRRQDRIGPPLGERPQSPRGPSR